MCSTDGSRKPDPGGRNWRCWWRVSLFSERCNWIWQTKWWTILRPFSFVVFSFKFFFFLFFLMSLPSVGVKDVMIEKNVLFEARARLLCIWAVPVNSNAFFILYSCHESVYTFLYKGTHIPTTTPQHSDNNSRLFITFETCLGSVLVRISSHIFNGLCWTLTKRFFILS